MRGLTPEKIVRTAREILADKGFDAMSMRGVASRLNVTPMALYHHFPDRDALLLAIIDEESAGLAVGPTAPTAAGRALEVALTLHDFLAERPWMIRLIATGRLASPAGLQFPEALLAAAKDAGLTDVAAFAFYRSVFAATLGQATITAARASAPPARRDVIAAADPSLVPIVFELRTHWPELDAHTDSTAVLRGVVDALLTSA